MITMKRILSSLFVLLLASTQLIAQEPQAVKQKMEMRIDDKGDANVTVSMTMNASQWQIWLETMGNNPALLKRGIERELPGYFLEDFKLEKNEMERSFSLSLKASGVTRVDKKGRWIVETEQKSPDITELSSHKFMMVHSDLTSGLQQTQIIEFPSSAENIKIDKDSFGQTRFIFEMSPSLAGGGLLMWIGILFLLAGGTWLVAGEMKKS